MCAVKRKRAANGRTGGQCAGVLLRVRDLRLLQAIAARVQQHFHPLTASRRGQSQIRNTAIASGGECGRSAPSVFLRSRLQQQRFLVGPHQTEHKILVRRLTLAIVCVCVCVCVSRSESHAIEYAAWRPCVAHLRKGGGALPQNFNRGEEHVVSADGVEFLPAPIRVESSLGHHKPPPGHTTHTLSLIYAPPQHQELCLLCGCGHATFSSACRRSCRGS